MYSYSIYGLPLLSEFCLDLPARIEGVPSVFISQGAVPAMLDTTLPLHSVMPTVRFQVQGDVFVLIIDNVARYLIESGQRVTVDFDKNADRDLVRLFLVGSALGVLLLQRGILPLHGSSIMTPNGAVIFCGASGHGKSTLAAAFANRGLTVMSDDVSAISFTENGIKLLQATSNIYLWQDAMENLKIDPADTRRAAERDNKYQLQIPARNDCLPVNIHSIYILQPDDVMSVSLSLLSGFEKIAALICNTYRLQFIAPMNLAKWHFDRATEIASQTRILVVKRPLNSYKLVELVEALTADYSGY